MKRKSMSRVKESLGMSALFIVAILQPWHVHSQGDVAVMGKSQAGGRGVRQGAVPALTQLEHAVHSIERRMPPSHLTLDQVEACRTLEML